jgi:hypothetical protein
VSREARRGYYPEDERFFAGRGLETLWRSAEELYFLQDRGYQAKSASTFIGNHHLLSERQRVALTRIVATRRDVEARLARRKQPDTIAGETVHIDGFNEIITLEVAQSGSPVFRCMDGAYRDLAGLRGTYRLIDKTDTAIRLLFSALRKLGAGRAVFWLDEPVSNSGRLKTRIAEIAEEERFDVGIELTGRVDEALCKLQNVVTSDSVILDRSKSWLNLSEEIVPGIPGAWILDFRKQPD